VKRRGILLAGGAGTRLHPVTRGISKQLLPIYDKPMFYYPLSVLMLAGIREIMVISTPHDLPRFEQQLGDGAALGIRLVYAAQAKPEGIAQSLIIAERFLDGAHSALVLGDNIFFGQGFSDLLTTAHGRDEGATVFAYRVPDPERYGVVDIDAAGRALSIVEKPKAPKSDLAVTGLYFYDPEAPALARALKPSPRGELEITDLNRVYLERGKLWVEPLGRGFAWLDTGTHDSLLDAANYVATIERRQGLKIACLEEIAWRQGWIDREQMRRLAEPIRSSAYGAYLMNLAEKGR